MNMGARGKTEEITEAFFLYITGQIVASLTNVEITGADGNQKGKHKWLADLLS